MARTFSAASSQKAAYTGGAAVSGMPLTLACWYKPADIAGVTSKALMSVDNGATTTNFFLLRSIGAGGNIVAVASVGDASTTAGAPSVGTWSHCAAVFASSTSRTAYLDGTAATTATGSGTPGSLTETKVGVLWTSTQYADGDIAEAAIWNVALSSAEIALLAKGISPSMIQPQALVAYWPLFGNDSPEPPRWGANALTLTNSPAKADHIRMFYPAYTGVAAFFFTGYNLAADVGSYALTGLDTALLATRQMAAAAGAYTYTGAAASLEKGFFIISSAGSYAITGVAATFRHVNRAFIRLRGIYKTTQSITGKLGD